MSNLIYSFSTQDLQTLDTFANVLGSPNVFTGGNFSEGFFVNVVSGLVATIAADHYNDVIPNDVQQILDNTPQIDYVSPTDSQIIQTVDGISVSLNYLRPISPFTFVLEGAVPTGGTWLYAGTKWASTSDLAPILSPANAKCVAISATFENVGAGGKIQFWDLDTNTPLYEWEYTNTPAGNTAVNTGNIDNPFFDVSLGQKVGVKIDQSQGVTPFNNGVIIAHFVLTERADPTEIVS